MENSILGGGVSKGHFPYPIFLFFFCSKWSKNHFQTKAAKASTEPSDTNAEEAAKASTKPSDTNAEEAIVPDKKSEDPNNKTEDSEVTISENLASEASDKNAETFSVPSDKKDEASNTDITICEVEKNLSFHNK